MAGMAEDISSLPIHLAIRLLLDSVSFSNPLPNWFDTITVDYARREEAIRSKIREYLGGTLPKKPFEIQVPKKNGQLTRWIVPSVNDQIIFQACVSSIAEQVDGVIDKRKVFSCRYNRDPNRLALLENQVSAWKAFQDETESRCQSEQCVLQIDLEDAYRHIDRSRFFAFLRKLSPGGGIAVRLLEILHEAFAGGEPGLPLMNDSGFFLGNAYLSEIDRLVDRRTGDFIRFVDDYRIFADSRDKLESLLQKISSDLQSLGFQINSHKLKLGSGEEYLEAISTFKYAEKQFADYIDVAFGDILQPADLIGQISKTLEKPDEYLNQGFGRLQFAELRKIHVDALIASSTEITPHSLRYEFSKLLVDDSNVLPRVSSLLKSYAQDDSQLWRTLWLLYLIQNVHFYRKADGERASRPVPEDLLETVTSLRASNSVPQIVKLWASDLTHSPKRVQELLEQVHDSDYLEWGIRYLA
jgi:hypothetical protein